LLDIINIIYLYQ